MRYLQLTIKASSEYIEKNSKIRLKDYYYDSTIGALNVFMYRKMTNYLSFLAYREEEGGRLLSVFAYDEQKRIFDDVYSEIMELLRDSFGITRILSGPAEITIYQFLDCVLEAKRRDLSTYWSRIIDTSKVWIYEYDNQTDERRTQFNFSEKIIGEPQSDRHYLLDKNFMKELENIDLHAGEASNKENVVHYILSAHGSEAAADMAELLAQRLLKADRISSRRMEIVSEIAPTIYKAHRFILEDIIENNYGGTIVLDLSGKFGCDPVEYQMACRYIEKLVKKHCNHCLFFFIYNIDNPGFAYYLLPNLKDYLIPVTLREGKGDRKEAASYLKELIKTSGHAKYAGQAGEFLKQYPGNEFTQTDVLEAFEKFGPWCMNKNVFKSYNYNISDDFRLERETEAEAPYDKLQNMTGLSKVKEKIDRIIASDLVEKQRKKCLGKAYHSGSMHMIFAGDPGTAKTTVAQLFAGIAKDKGILKSGAFVVRGGMDLCGLGCVAAIREAFKAAEGGVLFIDEAYSMAGETAISVLIQEMENKRDSVIVILAGYQERMKGFLDQNEGLKSRIPYYIEFPNYDPEELTDIFRLMLKERHFSASDDAIEEAHTIFKKIACVDNFGNGRAVRNLLDRTVEKQSVRLYSEKQDLTVIGKEKLFHIKKEDIEAPEMGMRKDRIPGTAQKELDAMTGLSNAKALLRKAIAFFRLEKEYLEKGISRERAAMHMVFTGNPGTAKTTVARLFAEIMKDEKILPTGQFVEVGRADLIGTHVGETAPKVRECFRAAQGGVLFIDEAYSLCDGYEKSFGDEAINTIVQEMENHREDVIVIFAGYSEPMKEFLDRNPGMLSRIAFQVRFDDYSTDELCAITKLFLSRRQMNITDAAMKKLRSIFERERKKTDYGNGRFVRKILDEAGMNLADRVSGRDEAERTLEYITTIEECDIPDVNTEALSGKIKMGFSY